MGGNGFVPYYLANNTDNGVQAGFNNAAIASQLSGIQGSINNGFSNAEIASCNRAMADMERSCTTYQDCEKLATFYILLSHAYGSEPIPSVESTREIMVSDNGGSDFLRAVAGKDADAVWHIMDEVMDTIRAFQPRLYDATLQKLNI